MNFRLPFRDDFVFGWVFLLSALSTLAFDIYAYEAYETLKYGFAFITIGFGLIFLFKKIKSQESLSVRLNKGIVFIFGGFILWSLVCAMYAWDINYAFFSFYPRFTNSFIFFSLLTSLFFLLSFLEFEKLKFLIKAFYFYSLLIAIWGITQSLGLGYYTGPAMELFSRAAPSFLGNPNFSSMVVAVLIPIGIWLLSESEKTFSKTFYFFSLIIQIFSLVAFSSRGSILAAGLGMFSLIVTVIFFGRLRYSKLVIFSIAALSLLGFFAFIFLNLIRPDTVVKTINLTESNVTQRLGIWEMSYKAFMDRPFVGAGLGNFELVFEKYRAYSGMFSGFFDDPHNIFIYMAIAGGLPLLLLFLGVIFYPMYINFKKYNIQEDSGFSIAVSSSVLAWAVAACFTPVPVTCFILLIFFISCLFQKPVLISGITSKIKFPILIIGFVFLIFGIAFISAEQVFFASTRYYKNGDMVNTEKFSNIAVKLNPFNSYYYQYLTAAQIIQKKSGEDIEKNYNKFLSFHIKRSYTYVQVANLNYLKLYSSQNPAYIEPILNNMDKAIKLDPLSAPTYSGLAQFYFVLGSFPEAIESAKKSIQINPTPNAWLLLAKIYQYQNNKQMVLESIAQAIKLDRTSDSLQSLLALARKTDDIKKLPFTIQLTVGSLD